MIRRSCPAFSSVNCVYKTSFHAQLPVKENGYAIQLFDIPKDRDIQGKFIKTHYNSVKRRGVKEATQECNKIKN